MCTDASVEESSHYGSKRVDSVLLRITKHQNNCICHVTLPKTVTNFTIYMSKHDLMQSAAPEIQNCGLAVDVENVDISNTSRSLPPIECTSGTDVRSIVLGGNGLRLKSRIINGNFSRGYCMQIYRNEAIYTCNMNNLPNRAGTDGDWIATNGTQHTSFIECKRYCLDIEACLSVHYEQNYCFVYNRTTSIFSKDNSSYSQKYCIDTKSR
ncbi:unnamed protein product [Mytilus coruscus]|uniref:Apple domain-containing protein n=1 Tax=Mytilus coruscus TaxID=42192 RepID=A0A6J8AF20_MYTCO|nr:unnamed protein product [Mytilus coruscus]